MRSTGSKARAGALAGAVAIALSFAAQAQDLTFDRDPTWGETVCAAVVRRPGATATEDELLAWCRERIAGYKRPRAVVFIEEAQMPRTATGKIQHRVLRDRLAR